MITIKNLYKTYHKKVILEDINLKIEDGKIVALVGPSGSGKTTLARLIHGLDSPDQGVIRVDGTSGFVFQDFNLFPHMNVMDNLIYTPIYVQKKSVLKVKKDAYSLLKNLNMQDHADKYPHQLSGGQKQRVALARSLILSPNVLILDEPTSALDSESSKLILNLIKKRQKEGKIILIVSHDLVFIKKIKNCEILTLKNGKILL